jgi:DNA polymerase
MAIDHYRNRGVIVTSYKKIIFIHPKGLRGHTMNLEELNSQIRTCRKCRLWKLATHAVPGEGPSPARIMVVGQNPGEKEDKTGRPFIGRAGTFLNKILRKNSIDRKTLFITSVVKHKTPQNRRPKSDEIEACMPYLMQQIDEINPDIMILMGKVAWETPQREDITYIKTYHPAAAMRFPRFREKFEADFNELRNIQ